jgi:hypothetical protein
MKRMGATTHANDSSHVPMPSHASLASTLSVPPQKLFRDHPLQRETHLGEFRL